MKQYLFRNVSGDELRQIDSTIDGVLKRSPALIDQFSGVGYDLDDVRQEARFIGWRWIARRDLTTDPATRFRMLRNRVEWSLRDLLRVLTGARRKPETRELMQAIRNAASLDDGNEKRISNAFRLCDALGASTPERDDLDQLGAIIRDAIDDARTI